MQTEVASVQDKGASDVRWPLKPAPPYLNQSVRHHVSLCMNQTLQPPPRVLHDLQLQYKHVPLTCTTQGKCGLTGWEVSAHLYPLVCCTAVRDVGSGEELSHQPSWLSIS